MTDPVLDLGDGFAADLERTKAQREQARDLAARFAVETLILSDALHDAIAVARGQIRDDDARETLLANAERVLDDLRVAE